MLLANNIINERAWTCRCMWYKRVDVVPSHKCFSFALNYNFRTYYYYFLFATNLFFTNIVSSHFLLNFITVLRSTYIWRRSYGGRRRYTAKMKHKRQIEIQVPFDVNVSWPQSNSVKVVLLNVLLFWRTPSSL